MIHPTLAGALDVVVGKSFVVHKLVIVQGVNARARKHRYFFRRTCSPSVRRRTCLQHVGTVELVTRPTGTSVSRYVFPLMSAYKTRT